MLQRAQRVSIDLVECGGFQFQFDLDDLLDLNQKPAVDLGQCKDFLNTQAHGKRIAHVPNAVRTRRAEFLLKHFAVLRFFVHPINADFKPAQGFLERLLESPAHGHDFANRLHLCRQTRISRGEFLKRKTWNLGHHVIDARLETGRRRTTGDVVAQLVQRVANGQLGRHFGNRKTSRFRRQSRRTRNTRIHLDHDHAAIVRVDRELHVRAARVDADFAQHSQRGVAQNLVFLVGQRLGWRDGDRVTGVHAHRVQVFN